MRIALSAIAAVAIAAALLVLVSTSRWGPGVTPDSVAYLDAARSLQHGHGLTVAADEPLLTAVVHRHAPYPLLFWAPGYPTTIGGLSGGQLHQLQLARALNIFLFACIVFLTGLVVMRVTASRLAALVAAGVIALSPVAVQLYSEVLAEPLFVLLSYGAILVAALASRRPQLVWVASLLAAAALLTRFAGIPLLAATIAAVVAGSLEPLTRRVVCAVAGASVSLIPLALWLVRNRHETGSATGRTIAWHPISLHRLAHGVDALTMLILPSELPAAIRGAGALLLVVGLALAVTRIRPSGRFERGLLAALITYLIVYPLFLVVSISVFDAVTNLSQRFLFPMFPAAVVVASWGVVSAVRAERHRTSLLRMSAALAVVVVIAADVHATAKETRSFRRDGLDYTDRYWRTVTRQLTPRLAASATTYSDRPELISFATGQKAVSLPATVNPMDGRQNASLKQDLARLRASLRTGDRFVFFAHSDRWYLVSPTYLVARLHLVLVSSIHGAKIFRPS